MEVPRQDMQGTGLVKIRFCPLGSGHGGGREGIARPHVVGLPTGLRAQHHLAPLGRAHCSAPLGQLEPDEGREPPAGGDIPFCLGRGAPPCGQRAGTPEARTERGSGTDGAADVASVPPVSWRDAGREGPRATPAPAQRRRGPSAFPQPRGPAGLHLTSQQRLRGHLGLPD